MKKSLRANCCLLAGILSAKSLYQQQYLAQNEIVCKPTEFNKKIVAKFDHLNKYKPPLFIANAWSQLSWFTFTGFEKADEGESLPINFHRQNIPLEDGGQMSIDWQFHGNVDYEHWV